METRALVYTFTVVLTVGDARLLVTGAAALVRGDEGSLFAALDCADAGAAAADDCGGVLDLGASGVESWEDAGADAGAGVETGAGAADDAGCRAEEAGGGDGVLPVPLACRFSP